MRQPLSRWEAAAVLVVLISLAPAASAIQPTQVFYADNHVQVPFYGYADKGNCKLSCLGFEPDLTGGGHDAATYNGKWANYTDFALGGISNPTQTFGVGPNQVVANLSAMNAAGLEFIETQRTTFGVGMPALHVYTTTFASEVVVTQSSLATPIFQNSFVTTVAAFAACTAPCVFGNAANNTVVVKTPTTMPQTVDIYFTQPLTTSQSIFPFLAALLLLVFVGISVAMLYQNQKRGRERRR